MKNLLEQLYYVELEENPQLLPHKKEEDYDLLEKARDSFFNALTKEQKKLYLAYEDIQREWRNEESLNTYKCAFRSGFQFAQEIFTPKNI